ncbi:MAG TPA: sensor histidine kinase KdpD [Dehalococcoidia bacterium]|nr:sensor histidine kinase KdpD [Dehalococcoidia bacterium]
MTIDDARPDPEALLARARRDEREASGRGRLRIFIGAFPGVGKTYTMLSEAHRRVSYGEDVVVGFVETHGRAATEAQIAGLEVLPRKRIAYRGVTVEELDVDAVLRRHPSVCLVDELAHTNAPGSEREKRYEDVDTILEAGINVVTTLNVQHLESLNDTVQALTGVRVRETIPDRVVDEADELILIDLTPEGARARMEHGHIYPPAQAAAALRHFFRPENLAALRELALRRTAQEVDEQLDVYMRESARQQRADIEEHVLVFIDGSPFSRTLIRRGWRIAQGLRATLAVAYLRRPMAEGEQADLARTLELAEDLNARVFPLSATDAATALRGIIGAEGVHHLVLRHERRGGVARLLKRSLADELMQALPNLDVHLVAEHGAPGG